MRVLVFLGAWLAAAAASGGGGGGGGAGPVVEEEDSGNLFLTGAVQDFPGGRTVYVKEGASVEVTCNELHETAGKRTWRKPNGDIVEPISETLKIPRASVSDSGTYECFKIHETTRLTIVVGSSEITMTSSMDTIAPVVEDVLPAHLVLSCTDKDAKAPSAWLHNGQPMDTEDSMVQVFDNGTLIVKFVNSMHTGFYSCEYERAGKAKLMAFIKLKGAGYVHQRHASKNMMEGEDVVLKCEAYGYPTPTITWWMNMDEPPCSEGGAKDGDEPADCKISVAKKNETVPMGRFTATPYRGVPGAKLTIAGLEFSDRAKYYCCASNKENGVGEEVCEFTMVRVKDKLAALWPFLGIVAEVIILVTIIFIYEKRRASKEAAEDGEAPDQ